MTNDAVQRIRECKRGQRQANYKRQTRRALEFPPTVNGNYLTCAINKFLCVTVDYQSVAINDFNNKLFWKITIKYTALKKCAPILAESCRLNSIYHNYTIGDGGAPISTRRKTTIAEHHRERVASRVVTDVSLWIHAHHVSRVSQYQGTGHDVV